jgi:hypothetical protein
MLNADRRDKHICVLKMSRGHEQALVAPTNLRHLHKVLMQGAWELGYVTDG